MAEDLRTRVRFPPPPPIHSNRKISSLFNQPAAALVWRGFPISICGLNQTLRTAFLPIFSLFSLSSQKFADADDLSPQNVFPYITVAYAGREKSFRKSSGLWRENPVRKKIVFSYLINHLYNGKKTYSRILNAKY